MRRNDRLTFEPLIDDAAGAAAAWYLEAAFEVVGGGLLSYGISANPHTQRRLTSLLLMCCMPERLDQVVEASDRDAVRFCRRGKGGAVAHDGGVAFDNQVRVAGLPRNAAP